MKLAFFGEMKKEYPVLSAKIRNVFGHKVKKLRKEGLLPGNLFGKDIKSQALVLDYKEFSEIYKKVGETGILELKIDKKTYPVLVANVQRDPVEDAFLHVDLRKVDLKQKVVAKVPVELVGEAPAQKQGLGALVQYVDEIEVEALPADLPEKFEVDVQKLVDLDSAISVSDLVYDKDRITVKGGEGLIIAKVEPIKEEQVVEEIKEEEKEAQPAVDEEMKEEETKGEEEIGNKEV